MKTAQFGVMLLSALVAFSACHSKAEAGVRVIKAGDNYKIYAQVKKDKKDSLKGVMELSIEPTGGWKMEKDKGPASITIEPPKTMELKKTKWVKGDAEWDSGGKKILYKIPYTLKAKGEHSVKLKFRFVLCNDKLCQMKRFDLDYSIDG